jgi:hypothetical protein
MTKSHDISRTNVLDSAGIFASGLCIAHCLLLPLVASILPLFIGEALLQPAVHFGMLATVVPIALVALIRGYRGHGQIFVLAAGAIGLLGLLTAHPVAHTLGGHGWERLLTVVGGVFLSGAHLLNIRACTRSGSDGRCAVNSSGRDDEPTSRR